ncbi:MAG: helicase-exonuclease AddAB subunit AddA [Clostridia bacterium]|nr:helicase-exonuclease AddAB subunit AddA [Clostridia bacterium]
MINKIVNEKVDIDKVLVVTFTNAAASEMKERILDAIYKKLEEKPNPQLQKQITILNKANICTIDSFCLDVIKNNFYELDISPNFRIGDTAEIELLKQEVLEEIFEKKYIEENKEFSKLIETYTSYRDDTPLKELILKIYTYMQSNPFPEKWLKENVEKFNIKNLEQDFAQTKWGKILLKDLEEELVDCIEILKQEEKNLSKHVELEEYKKIIINDREQLELIKANLDVWDKAYQLGQDLEYIKWSKSTKITLEEKENAKKSRDTVKAKIAKKLIQFTSKEANRDIFDMYEILNILKELIIEFTNEFQKIKKEKNILDFNDIEHYALNILVKEENGKVEQTEVAKKYQNKFIEIAIDEYQDSNLLQEYILTSISNNKNIFMVGDVKQSIYKFRQARPDLFYNKYVTYKLKENQQENDDLKIQLFKNFRSRKNILEFTNIVFENLMTENPWEIKYNKEEYLNLGADYKDNEQNLKIEIKVIDPKTENKEITDILETVIQSDKKITEIDNTEQEENDEEEHIEDIEIEARFVANKIKEIMDSNYKVYDTKNKLFKDIKYKDIAILLRSTKTSATVYEKELIKLGIPVFSDTSSEYLGTIEIQTIINLLKIIDNPLQDIPLVTVMRSSIGNFTDNDLIQIRLCDKYDNFYNTILKSRINVEKPIREKIEKFLDNLEKWREEQEYLALDELIWKIYQDTGYYNYVGLMPNGQLRQANLKMLFERSKQYEKASFKGLFNFINFIEKIHIGSGDLGSAKIIGENEDVVRIMSIHKSKGLEFPIVFLANTGKQFNMMDLKERVLLHSELGIGVKYINYEKQIEYNTLSKTSIASKLLSETMAEEMRILYVALTRAKEKLYITGISKEHEKQMQKMKELVERYSKDNGKINPIIVKKYKRYIDWIMLVYLYNKEKLQEICTYNCILKDDINLKQHINNISETTKKCINIDEINIDKEILEYIKQKLEYKYPDIELSKIQTKTSVSKIKKENEEIDKQEHIVTEISKIEDLKRHNQANFAKPKFLENSKEEEITASKKGTIIHLCMQKLDINTQYDEQKITKIIEEMQEKNIITQKEAESIDVSKIYNFTKSDTWKRMKKAKLIQREKPFYINLPIESIYKQELEGNILVQGVIDLYFIDEENKLVLVDYKTDYVDSEENLVKKYKVQLQIYKEALEEALQRKVDETIIYSTWRNKAINVK